MQMREPNGKFAKKGSATAAKPAGTTGGQNKGRKKGKILPKAQPATGLINRFALVLDASGSMSGLIPAARAAANKNIQAIRDSKGQAAYLTVVKFGDPLVDFLYEDRPVVAQSIPQIGLEYRSHGGTPLRDAVGAAVESMSRNTDSPETSYVVIAITDGQENESRKYDDDRLRGLIEAKQATGRWSFIFLVPPGSKRQVTGRWGVPSGNVREWDQTVRGVQEAEVRTSGGIGEFYKSRSAGVTATTTFYSKEQ